MMAYDPSKYVYQPHPLQNWDLFGGLRDLRNFRQKQEVVDETGRSNRARETENTAGRNDENARFAAQFAAARSDEERKYLLEQWKARSKAADLGRQAAQGLDNAGARAAGANLSALGGTFNETPGDRPGYPNFEFNEGQFPQNPQLDVAKARSTIFGAPQGGIGQSFPMSLAPGGNKFDRLPGASAAIAGPPTPQQTVSGNQSPTPPGLPGSSFSSYAQDYDRELQNSQTALSAGLGYQPTTPQIPTPELQPPAPMAPPQFDGSTQLGVPQGPPLPGEAPAAPTEPPPTLRNPMETQSFSPYRISTSELADENKLRLQPFGDALVEGLGGADSRYGGRAAAFFNRLGRLGYPPEKTLELTKPYFSDMTGVWRGEMNVDAMQGRLNAQEGREDARRDAHVEDREWNFAKETVGKVLTNEKLSTTKEALRLGAMARRLAEQAGNGNRDAAHSLIGILHQMSQKGMMTDRDYAAAKEGIATIWTQARDNLTQAFIKDGFDPDRVKAINEFIDTALAAHIEGLQQAESSMYRAYTGARSDGARQVYEQGLRTYFPEEYWTPEVRDLLGGEPAKGSAPNRIPGEDNLGVAPVNPRSHGTTQPKRAPTAKPTSKPITEDSAGEMSPRELLDEIKRRRGDK